MNRFLVLAAALLWQSGVGLSAPDARIRLIPYDGNQVVTLAVAPGYAAVIEVPSSEAIDSVVVGNSAVWQITQTQSGNRIVVKPLSGAVQTDMVVLTDQRRYVFLLTPSSAGDQSSFVVRFNDGTAAAHSFASTPVATYKLHGSSALFPVTMYDDGKRTTVRWAGQTPLPAIFSIQGSQEAVVNGRMVGSDYIIEGTASRYRLRYGTTEAVAVRRVAKRRK